MAFCLIPKLADDFIKRIRDGSLDPEELSKMSSEQRHDVFKDFLGEDNAKQVNSLFESKLLLKNQKAGYLSWIKKVGGLTPQVRSDLITRIGKMDRILNPEEEKSFLKDLASTKIGADISPDEAKTIFDLSNKVKETSQKMEPDFSFKNESDRLAYGDTKVALANYVNELKGNNKITLKSVTDIASLSKSVRASMDDSAIFHQGWKTLVTHPLTWSKNAFKSFSDLTRTLGGKEVMDEIMADRESRQNELNGNYDKMGLAVNKAEEAYPTSLPEKVPVLGRVYKASENAYTGFVYRQRMDIADKYLQIAKDQKIELTPKELKSIGSMVNSLTGRGNLGKYEPAAGLVNSVFFSPRYIKSQVDTLSHVITGAGGSNFVRKQAAWNLVKVAGAIATIITVSNAIKPGSAETDTRSSDFGKIRIGDTRFDVTGGLGSLITLASRIASQSSKSSTTGKVSQINSGKYGAPTGKGVLLDYMTNKLSPISQVVVELLNRSDFSGKPITVVGEAKNLIEPLTVANYEELKSNPNSANLLLTMIADGLGIATNTYSAKPPKQKK